MDHQHFWAGTAKHILRTNLRFLCAPSRRLSDIADSHEQRYHERRQLHLHASGLSGFLCRNSKSWIHLKGDDQKHPAKLVWSVKLQAEIIILFSNVNTFHAIWQVIFVHAVLRCPLLKKHAGAIVSWQVFNLCCCSLQLPAGTSNTLESLIC